jgi:hypothetical protein
MEVPSVSVTVMLAMGNREGSGAPPRRQTTLGSFISGRSSLKASGGRAVAAALDRAATSSSSVISSAGGDIVAPAQPIVHAD